MSVGSTSIDDDDPAASRPDGSPRRRERGFGAALGWTVAGAVVPGTGHRAAGRRPPTTKDTVSTDIP
ncbi:MAG TPA: hypothetical protein VGN47_04480 [Blastococcus sp.]|nr:hypothetical protein [Blastococcus sp.]